MSDKGRLKIRMRRGTRELDFILQRFVEQKYETLTPPQCQAFDRLLDQSDPELMDWIIGRDAPQDTEILDLVKAIRATTAS